METITINKSSRNRNRRRRNANNTNTITRTIVNTVNVPRRRRRNRRNRTRNNQNPIGSSLVNLVRDPCFGPLVRNVDGSQITERLRTTVTMNSAGSSTSGYMIWYPAYHNPAGGGSSTFNAFFFEHAASTTVPINTSANPLGTGGASGSAMWDPAGPLLAGSTFSRGKTLSACMQLEYIGPLSSVSGQVAIIPNFSLRAFNSATTTPVVTAITPEALFSYASTRERLQITGHEVVWRPSDSQTVFRTGGNELLSATGTDWPRPNAVFLMGDVGSTSTVAVATEPDITGIAIAWKGIPNVASQLSISLVKAVALELAPSGYSIESEPTTKYQSSATPFATVTSWLDRNVPNWQVHAVNTGWNVAGQLAQSYAPSLVNMLPNNNRRRMLRDA